MDAPDLPDDDLDLALARAVERGDVAGPPPADPLGALLDARRGALAGPPPTAARADALWARVAAATVEADEARADGVRGPVRHATTRRPRWARVAAGTAAALAVLAVGGYWAVATFLFPRGGQVAMEAHNAIGSVKTLTLQDGSRVALRPHSTLSVDYVSATHTRATLEGEAFFDVRHDPSRVFEVEANGAVVAVLGTRFNVAARPGGAEVYLERGRVALTAPGGARVVLAPGQTATATAAGVTAPAAGDAEAARDWLDARVVFRATPAADVAAEVGGHYGLTLRLPADAAAETVSGALALGDEAATLDALGRVLGGRFAPDGPGAYRLVR